MQISSFEISFLLGPGKKIQCMVALCIVCWELTHPLPSIPGRSLQQLTFLCFGSDCKMKNRVNPAIVDLCFHFTWSPCNRGFRAGSVLWQFYCPTPFSSSAPSTGNYGVWFIFQVAFASFCLSPSLIFFSL